VSPARNSAESKASASPASWLQAVRQVVAAVRSSDVSELELANGPFSVRVRREPAVTAAAVLPDARDEDRHLHRVVAPFTGVYYRSPTPAAGVYVKEGDWVDADAVIGLVETMKIFNEVTADVAGRIVRFAAENGQLVHAGDPLVLLEPGERAAAESEPRP
jgi:acetyl-CoA carboxylase biotin carboxyl carrier protein